jgi:hypothetical protein
MQVGTKAYRYSEESGQKFTSSKRMILGLSGVRTVWQVVRTAGTVDRWASGRDDTSSGQLAGNRLFWLPESSETLLNSGNPVKQHLYIQVILSKQNEANHKLTAVFKVSWSLEIGGSRLVFCTEFDSEFHSALRVCLRRIEDPLALKPVPVCA